MSALGKHLKILLIKMNLCIH